MAYTILSIETSCDETAVSLVSFKEHKDAVAFTIQGEALYSQAEKHAPYGGVYPTLAKREHRNNITPLILEVFNQAGVSLTKHTAQKNPIDIDDENLYNMLTLFLDYKKPECVDAIAVTYGPGLSPALWVGVNTARFLSSLWKVPLIPVNHMYGHIIIGLVKSAKIEYTKGSILALLVSGGHTELVLKEDEKWHIIGKTLDDALGESFDKVARMLDLPYPGGPCIEAYAKQAIEKGNTLSVQFPRPLIQTDSFDVSYSGLKTATRRYIEDTKDSIDIEKKEMIAREFQDAAIETILSKTKKALEKYSPHHFVVGGGVAANSFLRKSIETMSTIYPNTHFHFPEKKYTTDNALMIALAGWFLKEKTISPNDLIAEPHSTSYI